MPSEPLALPSRILRAPGRPRAAGAVLVAVVLAVTALLGPTPVAAASSSDVVARVNDERAGAGLAPLRPSSDLTSVAQRWAERLAATGVLAHNHALADEVGGWSSIAENVGHGGDVAAVHGALMGSSGHRANILGGHTQIGAGVASGHGAVWVVQVFRTPSDDAPPAPEPAPEPPTEEPVDEPAPPAADEPEPERPEVAAPDQDRDQAEQDAGSGTGADTREAEDQASRSGPVRTYLVAVHVAAAAAAGAHARVVEGPEVGPRGPARRHEPVAV